MRSTVTTSFVLALVTLVLHVGPAAAARVLYVAGNGIDSATCGPVSQPCRSVGQAVSNASAGDRIVVGPGVYPGFVLAKAVTLESTHGAGATIIQGGNPVIRVAAADVAIGRPSKGFTIRRGEIGIDLIAADVRIEDNIVSDVRIGVFAGVAAPRATIVGNVISLIDGSFINAAYGIIAQADGMSIVQNVIQADGQGPAVWLSGAQSVVTDNVIAGAFEGVYVGTSSATIRRNTLVGNAVGLYFDTAGGPGLIATSNNLLGNDAAGGNCGVLNAGATVLVQGNYWGSAGGPGDDPADDVCGQPAVTSPFLRTPVAVGAPAGR